MRVREQDRLESLRSYAVLDTAREQDYDDLTVLAGMACEAPLAAVCLLGSDRMWFKAALGVGGREQPVAALTCCRTVVDTRQPLVVRDLTADPRFRDDPLVVAGQVAAYAGVPLIGRDGLALGTFFVADARPRTWTLAHLGALRVLARQAVALLELRRSDLRSGGLPTGPHAHLAEPERLRAAHEQGELVPWFQPIVDLGSGRPVGLEALLRWHHPDAGVLSPAAFLPAVERSGLVLPVGRKVLADALRLLGDLRAERSGAPDLGVSVNVSPVQLAEPGLHDVVLGALAEHGLAPERLTLEITESSALDRHSQGTEELRRLRDAGVRLALDDYGTGFSNLQRALDLPLTSVKLDRSVVHRFAEHGRARTVGEHVMATFATLGLDVVAEGVETDEQRRAVLALGCAAGQGWLFGRPVPAAAVPGALSRLPADAA